MNVIFFVLIALAFVLTAWQQVGWVPDPTQPDLKPPMDQFTAAAMEQAQGSLDMVLGLIGGMALFLGLVKVIEDGGALTMMAKVVRPLMVRLFPDVPPDHPAMGAMILNMSANALGLGNAATPFGIRAMLELDKLNPRKGIATNAMALFLAINTSSVTLLPTGVIVWRQKLGSADPAGIFATTLFATICSTTVAILATKLLQRLVAPVEAYEGDIPEEGAPSEAPDLAAPSEGYPLWVSLLALAAVLSIIPLTIIYQEKISPWIVPLIIVGFLTFGFVRGVKVYESFVKGAKEGFNIAILILPYLIAVLVALKLFRTSGALGQVQAWLGPLTSRLGLPAEALPMALIRPLSGSGATGVMVDTMTTYGPDSYVGYLVSTLQGSTETTFYVLAVYYGAVRVRQLRHTLGAALLADLTGVCASVLAVWWLYGHLA